MDDKETIKIIKSIEELEELYTMHMITYFQYINIKRELEGEDNE